MGRGEEKSFTSNRLLRKDFFARIAGMQPAQEESSLRALRLAPTATLIEMMLLLKFIIFSGNIEI